MQPNNRMALVSLLVAASVACRPLPAAEKPCDPSVQALAQAVDYLVARDSARDLEGVLAGYAADVTWVPPVGEIIHGKAAIRLRYEKLFASFSIVLKSTVLEAQARRDLGFVVGRTEGTLVPIGQGTPITVDDKFVAIVRCEGGRWRVSHLIWSPRNGAAAP